MKRNYIIMGFVILIIAGGLTIWFVNKQKDNSQNNNEDNNQNNNEVIDDNEGVLDPEAYKKYAEKIVVVEGDNAWYYQFLINSLDDGENTKNFFTGCNLKYAKFKDIEGYENIGNNNQYPSLAISDKSTNGVTEEEEVLLINDYFDQKQFRKEITIKDLDELTLYNFDKSLIVDLFNKTYNSNFDKTISKFSIKGCSIQSDEEKDGYKYNIGVMHLRRGIGAIRIDLLYNDGTYLSELIENKKATNEQKEIYNNFQKIEEYIVENQEVNIRDEFDLNKDVYNRLFDIIETFDD